MFDYAIIIPTYNRAHLIEAALDSVLAQSVLNQGARIEVEIVDDGSTDNTAQVVQPYLEKHGAPDGVVVMRYTRLEKQGVVAARNQAIRQSRAPWVVFLDSDDYWTPQKLERQRRIMEADARVGLVHTSFRYVDEAGNLTGNPHSIGERLDNPCVGSCVKTLLEEDLVIFSSVMMKRDLIEKVAGEEQHGQPFDPRWINAQDYDLLLRTARHCHFGYVAEPLTLYRIHTSHGAMGNLPRAFGFHARVQMDFVKRHGEALGLTEQDGRQWAATFLYQRADSMFWQRKMDVARALCGTARELGLHTEQFEELERRLEKPVWLYWIKDQVDRVFRV